MKKMEKKKKEDVKETMITMNLQLDDLQQKHKQLIINYNADQNKLIQEDIAKIEQEVQSLVEMKDTLDKRIASLDNILPENDEDKTEIHEMKTDSEAYETAIDSAK